MSSGTTPETAGGPRSDAAHLDEDAECLEDPVHCGDARHQHDVHATHPETPATSADPAPQT
jgi:hypothetical protein